MRLSLWLGLSVLALAIGAGLVGAARAAQAMHPTSPAVVRAMRASVDHYRTVAWLYQRAARLHVTPTSYSYRRSTDPQYLQWTVAAWQRHEYEARRVALRTLRRRLDLSLPAGPGLHASLPRRVAYARTLALHLQRLYPGAARARSLASARELPPTQRLFAWQRRAAVATLQISHASRLTLIGPHWLTDAFACIHRYEGAWNANSGNGYYGGLQMDYTFMRHYGGEFLRRWGTADRWPAWAQIEVSVRAYHSGRGFYPWPNTAQACGLL